MLENTKYKVLLVEDNEIERRAFERFVENNDIPYDYVVAGSVSEAQRQLVLNQSTTGPDYRKFDIVISTSVIEHIDDLRYPADLHLCLPYL